MKLERVPPETVRSSASKLVDDSESVKERVAVSPAFREATSELMAIVGLRVSTEKVRELLLSAPSALVLPAESENLELATEMTPLLVLLLEGVKVAV